MQSARSLRRIGFGLTGVLLSSLCHAFDLNDTVQLYPADGSLSFGQSVSASDDTVVVGAWEDDDIGEAAGAAYVFARASGGWVQQAKLLASDGAAGHRFGWSVAIDGDTLVVGALLATNPQLLMTGAVYVFERSGSSWSQQQKLVGGAFFDFFGASVALSGNTLLVGAPREDAPLGNSGAVHVYQRIGGSFTEVAVLTANDAETGDGFGEAVAIAGDRIVVGSPQDDDQGGSSGSAYVFDRIQGVWSLVAKLTPGEGLADAHFGSAVDTDGSKVVVGAYLADLTAPLRYEAGLAYVFAEQGGTWVEEAELRTDDAEGNGHFGRSVVIRGTDAFVGAEGLGDFGAVYRFEFGAGGWVQTDRAVSPYPTADGMYGRALAYDERTLYVGAPDVVSPAGFTGACFVLAVSDPFAAYCFGDGTGALCPCGNAGYAGEGCANSSGAGAALAPAGSVSVAVDDLAFAASGLLPNQPALLFAGVNAVNGGAGAPFGDGLRCAGSSVKRLGVRVPDFAGAANWGPGLAGPGGWVAGDVRRFQVWYRDPQGSPCGTGFNLSNGVEVAFEP